MTFAAACGVDVDLDDASEVACHNDPRHTGSPLLIELTCIEDKGAEFGAGKMQQERAPAQCPEKTNHLNPWLRKGWSA
jgi:hypothetical protein